ncbi:helix-turn-helix transcriptional regulator [Elioraea sp. Yellowstone]|jgi:DNA-binding transcriptional ArsR family regulator|uniref:ArsR/SmtB family transcription factor n=1 Tax=Elioraea sp. Yellowstone TaxID=2592070 RepID=UPI00115380F2|nr:helix-turn-helix transcriptional regulator [Elioraea sp. Yellowstone]TQF84858.1 helix-turn-helix transcriptional regulator [Elioraea sp. Yellowstone]
MTLDEAAARLAQLGNRSRLEIMRLLIKAGPDGLSVGEIQAHLAMPASTLAFHLRGLVSAGLVRQTKDGRTVLCRPCFEVLTEVTDFLRQECCTGMPARQGGARDAA